MNVEKTNNNPFESLNSYLDKLQEIQSAEADTSAVSLVPKKEYGILKLSNDEEEDFSDLAFDEKAITKAGATTETTTNNTITTQANDTTTQQTKAGADNNDTTTSVLNNIANELASLTATLENVETLLDNYAASNDQLLAQIEQGKNGDTTINVSKCQKQYNEQQQKIILLTIEQLNLTNQINALNDIQEYQNVGTVASLDKDSEYKKEMINLLEEQHEIVNQLAEVRAKRLEAMEKGNDSTVSSLASQEKTLIAENRSLELQKLKLLSVINNSLDPENMEVYTDAQLEEIGLTIDVQDKKDELTTNRLYYLSKISELEAKKEITGDKNALREIEQQIWKLQQVTQAYTDAEKAIDKANSTYIKKGSTTALSEVLKAEDVNPEALMKDDGDYQYNEKDILYKDGKKYTGEYCGKMYKKGKLYNGKYVDKTKPLEEKSKSGKTQYTTIYYVNGEKFNGTKGKRRYVDGELAQGEYDGLMYKDGKTLTGLSTFTPLKADGKTPDTENTINTYYKKGQLGTGKYKGIFYFNGKPFTGTYKNKNYVNGIKQ